MENHKSAAAEDYAAYLAARDLPASALLLHASKASGQSLFQIGRDFKAMARSPSRLNLAEYLRHGLHLPDKQDPALRAAYISNDLHWPITHKCNNQSWSGVAEDKIVAATMLQAAQVAVPQNLAVIDRSARVYPGVHKISDAVALRTFLAAQSTGEIFGKIVDGMVSFGAFRIESADAQGLCLSGKPPMTYEAFMEEQIGGNAYVLQHKLNNHPQLTPFASALCTVRMVNMIEEDGVFCPVAVIKLPQGDNIADAFWRPGNLACAVNAQSGQIETVSCRNGPEVAFLEDHPAQAGLMGMTLPHWPALRELNARAAQVFAPIRYQSTDIAITPDGPVLIEINYGGGFDLPQYASGKGMLTPPVRAFFEGFGYDFDAPPPRRGVLARLLRR
ncbi:MAG: sugar-transfer associated ATP-grasp domain-containing protein [Sulfitobacter sp.]